MGRASGRILWRSKSTACTRASGADPPSSFSIDTSSVTWQWGSSDYAAFYWLSEDGDGVAPLAVLQPDIPYDAFEFFTDGPNSPFAAFTESTGGTILTGACRRGH